MRPSSSLVALSLYQLLASNRAGLFVVYVPVFLVAVKGATIAEALILVSAAYVAASLLAPVAGRMSDRVGSRRPFLLVAEATALPWFVAIPLLPSATLSGAAFIAGECCLSLGAPALNAYVADLTRQSERGQGYGLLNATTYAGGIVGAAIVGTLIGPFGLAVMFEFVAVVMVGTIAVVAILVPDLRQAPARAKVPLRDFGPLTVFSFTVSLRSLGAGAVGTFYGVYAAGLGATGQEISFLAIAGLGAGALVSVPAGRTVDRVGEIRGILYGTVITLGSLALFLLATSWWELLPAQALRTIGFAFLNPGMLAWVARMAPSGHRAEYLGFFALINSTLWSLGPFAGAVALSFGGAVGLFVFAVATTALSIVGIEWLYPRGRRAVDGRDSSATSVAGDGIPVR